MSRKFIIAIDLGGTNLKIALLTGGYEFKDRQTLRTRRFAQKDSLIQAIIDAVNKIIEKNCLGKADILGVGLGLPGPIDVKQGVVYFFPNIRGWKQVNLKKILQSKLGMPAFLDNDANLMSLAESKLGAARGYKNAVCLTLGTGVGGGIIIDGGLYRGTNSAAGEIGHIPINEEGPSCNCGGRACLEAYIGNDKIIKAARKLFRRNISLEELSLMARARNKQALQLWSEVGRRLGVALTGVVNFLNPGVIVIGGGVAGAGRALFDQVKKTIFSRAMKVQTGQLKVVKAKLGSDAGLIGAAILVKTRS